MDYFIFLYAAAVHVLPSIALIVLWLLVGFHLIGFTASLFDRSTRFDITHLLGQSVHLMGWIAFITFMAK